MINFKTDENLGKTVDKMTAMCFGYEPIHDMFEMRIYGGGHKFSRLCAFKFHSALKNHKCPSFSIAFVVKLRSKTFHHKDANDKSTYTTDPSQWFIFKNISPTQVDVLGKNELFANYGFDIDKFFDSDVFKLTVSKFKKLIEKGLNVEVPAFKKKLDSGKLKQKKGSQDDQDIERFSNAIKESLPLIDKPVYNDKYYSLTLENGNTIEEKEMGPMTVKDLLDDVNQWLRDDEGWKKAKLVVNAPDGKTYNVQYSGTTEDIAGGGYFFECGKEVKLQAHEGEAVNESKFECIVKKNDDGWGIYEKDSNMWVATFQDKVAAEHFAEEYPQLKQQYLKKNENELTEGNSKMTPTFTVDDQTKKILAELEKECKEQCQKSKEKRFEIFEYEGQQLANFWLTFGNAVGALSRGYMHKDVAQELNRAGEHILNANTHKLPGPTDAKDLGDSESAENEESSNKNTNEDEALDKAIEEALAEIYN